MDVRLPNGVVVKNVPDDINQEDLLDRVKQAGIYSPDEDKPKSSAGGALGRGAVRGLAPGAAALAAGGEMFAATGGPFNPWISVPASLAIGAVAGLSASKLQDTALQSHPEFARNIGQSPEQQAADIEQHPIASAIGESVPQIAAFRPEGGVKLGLRLGGAAIGAGVEGAQQLAQGKFDPSQLALSAGIGATLTKPTRLGKALLHEPPTLAPNKNEIDPRQFTNPPPEQAPEPQEGPYDPAHVKQIQLYRDLANDAPDAGSTEFLNKRAEQEEKILKDKAMVTSMEKYAATLEKSNDPSQLAVAKELRARQAKLQEGVNKLIEKRPTVEEAKKSTQDLGTAVPQETTPEQTMNEGAQQDIYNKNLAEMKARQEQQKAQENPPVGSVPSVEPHWSAQVGLDKLPVAEKVVGHINNLLDRLGLTQKIGKITPTELLAHAQNSTIKIARVPYAAGKSVDGSVIYQDPNIPETLNMGSKTASTPEPVKTKAGKLAKKQPTAQPAGRGADRIVKPHLFTAVHETVERMLMDKGLSYGKAHTIAESTEDLMLREHGIDPKEYEDTLNPHVEKANRGPYENVPADLDPKPYIDMGEPGKIGANAPETPPVRRPGTRSGQAEDSKLASDQYSQRDASTPNTEDTAEALKDIPTSHEVSEPIKPVDSLEGIPQTGPEPPYNRPTEAPVPGKGQELPPAKGNPQKAPKGPKRSENKASSKLPEGWSTPEESQKLTDDLRGKSLPEVADHLAKNGPNSMHRAIAARIAKLLRLMQANGAKLNFHLLGAGDQLPKDMEDPSTRGYATTNPDPDGPLINVYIKGADFGDTAGTHTSLILHELIHAVTQGTIGLVKQKVIKGISTTEVAKAVRTLEDIRKSVLAHLEHNVKAGNTLSKFEWEVFSKSNNSLDNVDEVLTWGLSDIRMQKLLSKVMVGSTNLKTKLFDAIRKMLGIPLQDRSAFRRLLSASETLLSPTERRISQKASAINSPTGLEISNAARTSRSAEQQAALDKANIKVEYKPFAQRVVESVKQTYDIMTKGQEALGENGIANSAFNRRLVEGLFDFAEGAKKADTDKGIVNDQEKSSYRALRTYAASPKIAHYWLTDGQSTLKDGLFTPIEGKKPLLGNDGIVVLGKRLTGPKTGILDPIKDDSEAFFGWMVGKRSEYLAGRGKENYLSFADRKALISLGEGKTAQFEAVAKELREWHNNLAEVLKQSGILDEEGLQKLKQDKYYVPFRREFAKSEVDNPFAKLWKDSPIQHIVGGEEALKDPFKALTSNLWNTIDSALANNAIRLAAKAHPDMVVPVDGGDRNKGNIVRYKVDGDQVYARVDDGPMFRGLQGPPRLPKQLEDLLAPAKWASNLFRGTITSTPTFMVRVYIKHSMYAGIYGPAGFKPVLDNIQGLVKSMDSPELNLLKANGAEFGGTQRFGGNPESAGKSIKNELAKNGFESSVKDRLDVGPKFWQAYRALQDALENANRVGTQIAVKREGGSDADSVYSARDLQDYSLRGNFLATQILAETVPFFSARLFSIYKAGMNLDSKRLYKVAMSVATASSLLYMMNRNNPNYQSLTDQDKDANWHIFVGDQHFRIPKPFEIGMIMSSVPERAVGALMGDEPTSKALETMGWIMSMAFSVEPPQAIKPMLEVAMNKTIGAYGGKPIRNQEDIRNPQHEQYNENTSITMRDIGAATGLSPKVLQHLIEGYTGVLGHSAMSVTDYLNWKAKNIEQPKALLPDDLPLIGNFWKSAKPENSAYSNEMYQMLDKANETYNAISSMSQHQDSEEALEKMKDNMKILALRPMLQQESHLMLEQRKMINEVIRDDKMTSSAKRTAIDKIKLQMFNQLQATHNQIRKSE